MMADEHMCRGTVELPTLALASLVASASAAIDRCSWIGSRTSLLKAKRIKLITTVNYTTCVTIIVGSVA